MGAFVKDAYGGFDKDSRERGRAGGQPPDPVNLLRRDGALAAALRIIFLPRSGCKACGASGHFCTRLPLKPTYRRKTSTGCRGGKPLLYPFPLPPKGQNPKQGLNFGFGPVEAEFWRWMFVMTRIGAALVAAPFFGATNVPPQARVTSRHAKGRTRLPPAKSSCCAALSSGAGPRLLARSS